MIQYFRTKRVLVAHNVTRGHWGGMARLMEAIHTELKALGWETDYFTADDLPALGSKRFRRYAFTWYARRHAREAFLRGQPYDVINVHEPSGAAIVLGKLKLGAPAVVAMSHGVEQRYWELRLSTNPCGPEPPSLKTRISFPMLSLWQSRLTLKRADHVLCLNEEDREFLVNRFDIDLQRITRIFPGTSPEFPSAAARRSYDRTSNKLIFSGTWIERKGIRQLIEAFSVLAERYHELQLGLLGAGAPAETVLADFPASLHSRIVVFPPLSHAECAEVLLDYDLFLLPSFFEGTPLALIEAMCTGIPVITTATCGMKDVVQDGENGLLISPGNSEQLVRSAEIIMTDSHLRRRLGKQGARDASTKYTWKAAAELVNAAYSSALDPV
jgi:glycosyltransferase involved in cell wall biosynthesis